MNQSLIEFELILKYQTFLKETKKKHNLEPT